jgi:hypothetical protein
MLQSRASPVCLFLSQATCSWTTRCHLMYGEARQAQHGVIFSAIVERTGRTASWICNDSARTEAALSLRVSNITVGA